MSAKGGEMASMASITTKKEAFDLQKYLNDLLECGGAINDNPGFALIETLMPSEIADALSTSAHALLAFDAEVAAETPHSQFVTFGASIMDKALGLGKTFGRISKKYVGTANPRIPPGMLERAEKKLALSDFRHRHLIVSDIVFSEHVLFNFSVKFISDEKREYMQPVLVDAISGKDISYQIPWLNNVFCLNLAESTNTFQIERHCGYPFAYNTAKTSLSKAVQKELELFRKQMSGYLLDEMKRLRSYYQQTKEEIEKRISKIESNDSKTEALMNKLAAADADFKARMGDLHKKFQIRLEAELDSVIVYVVPKIRNSILIQNHTHKATFIVYYNLPANQVELPFCPDCGNLANSIRIKAEGAISCPECTR